MVQLGLVAVLAVAAAVLIALVGLFRLAWRLPDSGREQELVYILLAVFFFHLLASASGSINDNRDFWGMLDCLAGRRRRPHDRGASSSERGLSAAAGSPRSSEP